MVRAVQNVGPHRGNQTVTVAEKKTDQSNNNINNNNEQLQIHECLKFGFDNEQIEKDTILTRPKDHAIPKFDLLFVGFEGVAVHHGSPSWWCAGVKLLQG